MFQLVEKNGIVALKAVTVNDSKQWSTEAIATLFAESVFSRCYLDHKLLDKAIEVINAPSCTPGSCYPIGQRRDARIDIQIRADNMEASLILTGAWGGHTPSFQALMEQLQASGVAFGINTARLKQIAVNLPDLQPGRRVELRIATGKPAEAGEDGYLEQLVPTAGDRLLQPQPRDHGRVDMRDLGSLVTIAAGTPLMRSHPPTPGKAGITVQGTSIAPESGQPVQLTPGAGTTCSETAPDVLVASRDGVPVLTLNGMKVDDVLVQPKVDISTGHIRFKGSIIVLGDVEEGMRVESESDVTVGGSVASATIIATGDVTVANGIVGHQRVSAPQAAGIEDQDAAELCANIESGGRLRAAFAQYTRIHARGPVHIERQLTHCAVAAHQGIRIGRERHPDGHLIGGQIRLNGPFQAGEIGTDAGVRSDITLVMDYPIQLQAIGDRLDHLKCLHEDIETTQQTIRELQSQPGRKDVLELEAVRLRDIRERFTQEKQALAQQKAALEQRLYLTAIEVFGCLHPGIHVHFNNKSFICREPISTVKIAIHGGKPVPMPLHRA